MKDDFSWKRIVATVCFSTACEALPALEQEIILPKAHPCLAATTEELERVQKLFNSNDRSHKIAAAYVRAAEHFVNDPVVFPPRGGQHNQWYQCDNCEISLQTVDSTHHQCPKCKKMYTGAPYDDVIFTRQHLNNLECAHKAAWAYAISGKAEFAGYTAKVLLGYAERYVQYPYHSASRDIESGWGRKAGGHLFEQTLNEASALVKTIGPAYDLIHDSPVLSPSEHKQIQQKLLLPMLRNIDKNRAGKSNWQTWHNAAMVWGGALIGDCSWMYKAINDPENGFFYQMQNSISKDGMWYENSWAYHFYTLDALVGMTEICRRIGIDLWSDKRLKSMFTVPIQYTMADGQLPRFGDAVNTSVYRFAHLFEPAYNAYRDPEMLSVLNNTYGFYSLLLGRNARATAEAPALQSTVFKHAGHAILRAKGKAGLTAAMTFGDYGGFHGHFDKLSFAFYGFGEELGVDPGRAKSQAYRLPIHNNWYKATISHNTVLIDRRSQEPAAGELLLFKSADDFTAVGTRSKEAYPGVEHTRWCILTDSYLLVLDRLVSDKVHRADWLYHNRGRQTACNLPLQSVDLTSEYVGGQYIQNPARGVTDETIRLTFHSDQVKTNLILAAEDATTVTTGDGVGASVEDKVPMVMIGKQGRELYFAAVLEPVQVNAMPQVERIVLDATDGNISVNLNRGKLIDAVQLKASSSDSISVELGQSN